MTQERVDRTPSIIERVVRLPRKVLGSIRFLNTDGHVTPASVEQPLTPEMVEDKLLKIQKADRRDLDPIPVAPELADQIRQAVSRPEAGVQFRQGAVLTVTTAFQPRGLSGFRISEAIRAEDGKYVRDPQSGFERITFQLHRDSTNEVPTPKIDSILITDTTGATGGKLEGHILGNNSITLPIIDGLCRMVSDFANQHPKPQAV